MCSKIYVERTSKTDKKITVLVFRPLTLKGNSFPSPLNVPCVQKQTNKQINNKMQQFPRKAAFNGYRQII